MIDRFLLAALGLTFIASAVVLGAETAPATEEAVPVPAARQRTPEQAQREAALLHDAMHATLQLVHHRYYKEDEGLVIPAATLKEVFEDLEKEHTVKLRWLVVEGQAMNSEHVARNASEEAAVQALHAGKKQYEWVDQGIYHRAGPIALTNICLKCHVPDRMSTETRTAGLIIAIPLQKN